MKVLWVINTVFPYPAKRLGIKKTTFGGWLNGLALNLIENDIELAIATPYNCNDIIKFNDDKVTYYLVPGGLSIKYNKVQHIYWKKILQEFKPDLIHIHGTEYPHAISVLEANEKIKTVVSIQGLVNRIANVYLANISKREIIRNITIRDILRKDTLFQEQKKFKQRGIFEKEVIKRADAIIGRTDWDYANTKAINLKEKYYKNNETMRSSFYDDVWNIDNIERHSIFISQGSYPIKGLHYMIQALAMLKKQYNDVKLYVGGQNITDISNLKARLKLSGYGKYILKLIKKLKVEDCIVFTGILDEEQMKQRFLKSNVTVLPSVIENSSNSLGEAMLLGMPCVASNTGGTMDILENKVEGYLYPYTESAMCAEYVSKIFEDDNLAIKIGKNARKKALERHDGKKNSEEIIRIYKKIIESEE